jgi:uncharacterized MAPEG superfamily protein
MTMTTAYGCVLAAALLPYLWVAVAKSGAPRYDNRDPRGWLARQDSPRVRRANAAQLNAFEAFAPFAAGVLMAQLAGVPAASVATLALGFVGFRILHGLFYLADRHLLRSAAWTGGFVCMGLLMAHAILRLATA